jgi:hypothetical protein
MVGSFPGTASRSRNNEIKEITFSAYNKRHDALESLESSKEEIASIEDFKRKVIYPVILKSEEEEKVFTRWLQMGRDSHMQEKNPHFMVDWCNGEASDEEIKE